MSPLPLPSLVTIAALLLYFVLILNVGRARYKYQIMPPQVSGNPDFERVLRVQENTLEHLIIFLPALWLFSYFVSPLWASVLGAAWIVGRALYAWGYYQAPEKRFPGFGLSMLATLALLLGGLGGVILLMIKTGF